MSSYIDNYVGEWSDGPGNRLLIRRISDRACLVDFIGSFTRQPIARPWFHGKPSVDMLGQYFAEQGPELLVDLWKGQRFRLELDHESGVRPEGRIPECLRAALSHPETHGFLKEYYGLLGPLEAFRRIGVRCPE